MGPVQRYLKVSLDDVKEWLRLTNDVEASLIEATAAGDLVHKPSELTGLKRNTWVTIGGEDAKILYVDYGEGNVTVDRAVSVQTLTAGTPFTWHHMNRILVNAAEAAKSLADSYLGNSFEQITMATPSGPLVAAVVIPEEVRTWVLGHVAMTYERPEVGLVSSSQRESGSVRYDDQTIFNGIQHLRRYPIS